MIGEKRGINLEGTKEGSCGRHRLHGDYYTIDCGPSRKWDGGD